MRLSILCALALAGCDNDHSLSVRNDPPEVAITSPVDGSTRLPQTSLTLEIVASDRETPTESLRLLVRSDRAGALEGERTWTGDTLSLVVAEGLPSGTHLIEATLLDEEGAQASDQITLVVLQDADGDGFVDATSGGDDCDDDNAAIHPDADERCDGTDNDCDGAVDEDEAIDATTWFADADADGFGDAAAPRSACAQPAGFVADAADCDDERAGIHPDADERCDGMDNDCDGAVDEDDAVDAATWFADADSDGFGDPDTTAVSCNTPVDHVADSTDCDDTDASIHPGGLEVCNAVDDDCDGSVDVGATDAPAWYADTDADGYGNAASSVRSCESPTGHVADDMDCDDGDGSISPAATEVCDGVDNDCDTAVDEPDAADAPTWYRDADTDGFGDASVTTPACSAPSGYTDDKTDCDDADAAIHPAATEVCDGADNDCDSTVDEDDADDADTWYADGDGDGHGDPTTTTRACAMPSGHVASDTDCDDTDAAINPDEDEVCDGQDNDCDGTTDEDDATDADTWYLDDDADGYGQSGHTTRACSRPTGYAADRDDCDDADDAIHPGATERCNGIDDDCNSRIDDSPSDGTTYYLDADGDAYGGSSTMKACSLPTGYVTRSGDCDDAAATTYPGAPELCDSKDNDCDGSIDESKPVWYRDADGDGYGLTSSSTEACTLPTGYAASDDDCDDADSTVHPGASETCNDVDDDCDTLVDEDAVDATLYYDDDDDDGFGDASGTPSRSCDPIDGAVTDKTDCDDSDEDVFPGAPELCDGIDNDCDAATESGLEVPGTYATITKAITAASDGDTICLAAGTYYETIDFAGKDIVVDGRGGASKVILDGSGTGPVVTFEDAETSAAALTNVTVRNGHASLGAGIYVDEADPTFRHVIIEDNSCDDASCLGTGVYVNLGEPTFVDVILRDNEQLADGTTDVVFRGAGLYAVDSVVALHDVVSEGNIADATANKNTYRARIVGPGLALESSEVDLQRVEIVGNQALAYASSIAGTYPTVLGGADFTTCSGDVRWTRIMENEAQGWFVYGTGMHASVASGERLVFTNVVIGGNSNPSRSRQVYGAAYVHAGTSTLDLVNVDVVGNALDGNEVFGTLYTNPNVELRNVNIAYNEASWGSRIPASDLYGGAAAYYTNFYDNQPSSYALASTYTSSRGNQSLVPGFTDTSPSSVADWDLELKGSSAVCDLGDPGMADPDGSRSGIGAYSGPSADGW